MIRRSVIVTVVHWNKLFGPHLTAEKNSSECYIAWHQMTNNMGQINLGLCIFIVFKECAMLQVVNKIWTGLIRSTSKLRRYFMQHFYCFIVLSFYCISVKHLLLKPDLVCVPPVGCKRMCRIVIIPQIVDLQTVHHIQWMAVCVCMGGGISVNTNCTCHHGVFH